MALRNELPTLRLRQKVDEAYRSPYALRRRGNRATKQDRESINDR